MPHGSLDLMGKIEESCIIHPNSSHVEETCVLQISEQKNENHPSTTNYGNH